MRAIFSLLKFVVQASVVLAITVTIGLLFTGRFDRGVNLATSRQVLSPWPASGGEFQPPVEPVAVTIFAGWRQEQVAQSLHLNGAMDANRFYRVSQQGRAVNHPLLTDHPAGQSYEGYLFPGTYTVQPDTTPAQLITMMLDNLARQLPPNAVELARQQGLTLYQAITLASIVEREAALDSERPLIASVYLNRLRSDGAEALLQADPTVQYAMGYQKATNQWWKSPVSLEEYTVVDSPYNTYLHPGLPPGPIASPGLPSIYAVLYPASTNYRFFVCRWPGCEAGEHVFAATFDEHLQNVAAYYGN